ncbi:uncharacterized protein PAC_02442 [Phialocephala subalpina]|uniref:Uncharacterized protein n=1 Tax=Phialocephala subalpina TaxID=576137 RepID=A0A1L7WII0_9HELO|nr:uncharacterized protein PAC_02442 [Phialocephala subalpina]
MSDSTQNIKPGTVEPPHPTSSLTNTKWAKPNFTLPIPSLQFLFHLECDMESFHHIGDGGHGYRSIVIFKGGRFEGPLLRGSILPGGGDWENIQDHPSPSPSDPTLHQTAYLDTRYNLETHDGICIFLKTTGTRTGKKSILEGLGEEDKHAPDEYRMRLHLTFETGSERYRWLNSVVAVASSARNGDRVIYDAYQVL